MSITNINDRNIIQPTNNTIKLSKSKSFISSLYLYIEAINTHISHIIIQVIGYRIFIIFHKIQ